jgi:hypothetical protein
MNAGWNRARRWMGGAEFLSPKWMLLRAAAISVAFGLCECCGLREHTTFLSGSTASASAGWSWSVAWGVTYIVVDLGFTLVAPVLLLAAGFLGAWQRWIRPRFGGSDTDAL